MTMNISSFTNLAVDVDCKLRPQLELLLENLHRIVFIYSVGIFPTCIEPLQNFLPYILEKEKIQFSMLYIIK